MIARYVTGAGARAYHHTAPISMVFALHAGLGALLDEGLETSWKRHGEPRHCAAGRARGAGLRAVRRGRSPAARADHRVGARAAPRRRGALRRALLDRYGIEIGGGLGAYAGQVWRIGLMGHTARLRNVRLLLGARSTSCSAPDDTIARSGRRVSLRPLRARRTSASSPRCATATCDWLTKWEPARLAGQPDPADSYDAFVARCSMRQRERQLGTGYGFGIFCGKQLWRRDQPVVGAAGRVPERPRRLLDGRGPGRQRLLPRGRGRAVPLRLRGPGPAPAADLDHPPQPGQPPGGGEARLRDEGVAERYLQINGRWEDHVRYAVTVRGVDSSRRPS